MTLNSPDTLCALYSFARDRCDANERATRSVEYAGVSTGREIWSGRVVRG